MYKEPTRKSRPRKETVCKCGTKTDKGVLGKCLKCYQRFKHKRKKSRKKYNII